jgi:hypothetical protein
LPKRIGRYRNERPREPATLAGASLRNHSPINADQIPATRAIVEKPQFPVSRFQVGGIHGNHGTNGTFIKYQKLKKVYFWNIDGTLYRCTYGIFSVF